jgi:CRISPR-associated endonuclease/helicase Cas3
MPDLLFRYWGKAKPDREDGPQYHPLPYHCLDVAAVGKALLEQNPRLKHYLACLTGLNEECFSRWAVFFLALHDLGKFAESFQNQQPTLFKELQKRESNKNYVTRHDTLGFALWDEELRERFTGIGGRTRRRSSDHALDDWLRAVTGHHGKPPTGLERSLKDDFSSPTSAIHPSFARISTSSWFVPRNFLKKVKLRLLS